MKIEKKYDIEVQPKQWVEIDNKIFNKWVQKEFVYNDNTNLFLQQRFIRDFIQTKSPYRGILLYHGLGVGKTAASIVAAEDFINTGITVLLPASLKQNYISEISTYGNDIFSREKHWVFKKRELVTDTMLKKFNFSDAKYTMLNEDGKKIKGLWIVQNNKPSNFHTFSITNQKYIRKQINDLISSYYNFLHYNGINKKLLRQITEDNTINPFDNKLIIIDEVHNFISRVINKSKISTTLYNLIRESKNSKLILLSGTPLINYPHELSYLVNLLCGKLHQYSLDIVKSTFDVDKVESYLKSNPNVKYFKVNDKNIILEITPDKFRYNNKKTKLIRSKDSNIDDNIKNIAQELRDIGVKTRKSYNTKDFDLLPNEDEEFNSYFIDFNTMKIKNNNLLSQRLQGIVSYYNVYKKELYPTVKPLNIVKSQLSDLQFVKYSIERDKEIKIERKSKKYESKKDDNVFKDNGNVYRCFSRAVCNFTFPEKIKRPYPSTIDEFKKEMNDEDDQVEDVEEDELYQTYTHLLKKTMNKLRKVKDTELVGDNLAKYSPKYRALLDNINASPGTCVIYSQFKNVEGLGVLSIVLEANGYEELIVYKSSNGEWDIDLDDIDLNKNRFISYEGEPDYIEIILNIFNSEFSKLPKNIKNKLQSKFPNLNKYGDIVKLFMITQSGSEGISLKNVRQVHILEPYWNNIRLNQVIGRAVRANSHIGLPEEDRTVEPFLYIASFGDSSKNTFLEYSDNNLTSDEYIYDIANKKSTIIDSLLNIVKSASVDCLIHTKSHDNLKCFTQPSYLDKDTTRIYNTDINLDPRDNVYNTTKKVVEKKIVLKAVKFPDGKRFALDKASGTLYDIDKANNNEMVIVGKLVKNENNITYILKDLRSK